MNKGFWLALALLLALLLAIMPALLIAQYWLSSPCSDYQHCNASPNLQTKHNVKLAKVKLNQGLTLWQQGLYDEALLSLVHASELGSQPAELYRQYAQDWLDSHQNAALYSSDLPNWAGAGCLQQVLFVTSELPSLGQASDFIRRFNMDLRLQSLPICIAPKVVFVPQLFECDDVDSNTRISCDIAPLAAHLKDRQFTHLVIFTRQGKANVHNGIMYLDLQDTYDVLIHEMAHFAGFIDEYPLSKELAERVCSGIAAPNLVFQQAGQPQPDLHYWQGLGRTDIPLLSKARTCNNHSAQAFKTSKEMTFMEYHDLRRIPATYLAAWQASLQQNKHITPAFINFAQLYEQQNDVSAVYWRARYQAFHQPP